MLNKNELRELILVTKQNLNLSEPAIEKDFYVTQVIQALSATEDEYFKLIFAGGTCLAKAYKIVKRMSEDVDFKIQLKKTGKELSKTQILKKLKEFRTLIMSKLSIPGLSIGTPVVRNEGQYSRIEVDYPFVFPISMRLRPHILLEFTVSEVRLSIESLEVKTLIEDTLENIVIFSPPKTQCVSVNETAIEKWVGLTRRLMAIERGYHHDDKTLIRHVYDLNAIKKVDKIQPDFYVLAKSIVDHDAKQFKNQHPEYSADPGAEIGLSLALLKNKPLWKKRYREFIETMVYDSTSTLGYKSAMDNLENMSTGVISSLNPGVKLVVT